jgi:hypothetical protein
MKRLLVFALGLAFSNSALAYYSVLDNGEVLPQGHYKLTGTTQFLTDTGGANLAARFDTGITDQVGARALLGFGHTDFFVGGMAKWQALPETDNRPSVSLNGGLIYVKDNGSRDLILRLEPLASKSFKVEDSVVTPYVSLPLGVRMRDADNGDDDDDLTWQLVVGSQLQLPQWKNLQFIAEVGVDLDKAPGFVSLGALFYFDHENGMVLE